MATDYQVAESLKLELDYSDEKSDFRKTNFPARYIYERLLPSVVERLCDIYYHRSSPYSGFGKETTDKQYGDLHQCASFASVHVRASELTSDVIQGTSGTGPRNHGTNGMSSLAASCLSSGCE